jgi:PAS domain S-box-containing protein
MDYHNKTKRELIKELQGLNSKYDRLKLSYEQDISARNKTEEKLLLSEEKFRKAFVTSPDSISINRLDNGTYISINNGFTRITGYTEEEIIGKTSIDLNIWADPSDRNRIIKGLMEKGEVENLETTFVMKNGAIRNGMMSATLIDLDGIPHILSITRDITERKLAENALKENERLLRESQKIAQLGSFVWDLATGLWKSSIILDEIFGIDENYIRSFEGWSDIVHPDWRNIMIDYVTIEILGKYKKFDKEYLIIRQSDGQNRWVRGISELEFDRKGKPLKLIGTISDITELKKVENEVHELNARLEERVKERTAQLENANKELEAFSYSVSHDLRAPLRAIDGFSKFIIENYGSKLDSEASRLLGLVRTNAQKMDTLITDILTLSRISRSEHTLGIVDMTKMAKSMFNEVVSSEEQAKLTFIVDELPFANADATYIKQVWINLISNAVKFSSVRIKPLIRIGGYTENENSIYYIEDNGVGFNQEYADKLFGVFQRLHKVDEFEGTGVGLAIVKRIILRHGGIVWAKGKEGKGATFYFSLPVMIA